MPLILGTILYLILINFAGLTMMGTDKKNSETLNAKRTKESTFLIIALIGGSLGIILGMIIFRHKTMHKKFTIAIPIIFIVEGFIIFVIAKALMTGTYFLW